VNDRPGEGWAEMGLMGINTQRHPAAAPTTPKKRACEGSAETRAP
jgi:hypothetical protein